MMLISKAIYLLLASPVTVSAAPADRFSNGLQANASAPPIVDLEYARYQGYYDSAYGLHVWKGVRYAAPPVGQRRWQAPETPATSNNGTQLIQANTQPPLCPQSGAAKTPPIYGFNSGPGDEDCLFLNVFAPPHARNLPVFFWIHGGGYGVFGASSQDPSPLMNLNSNAFVSVLIQYRLGAFGFLASKDVYRNGQVNAGLLDQNFALQWVQKHIHKFGGDPKRVTLGGESSGAASAMLQAMAYGGKQNVTLFDNLIAASPYVAKQYGYGDDVPTQNYEAFAKLAGCDGTSNSSAFGCLVNADTAVLQNASAVVSQSGQFGTFAFQPVTDGKFVQAKPSQQLLGNEIQGKRVLIGNNANEGVPLSDPTINTAGDFMKYIHSNFQLLTDADVSRLLQVYQFDPAPVDRSAPLFDTLGDSGPTALNQSEFATGNQQRVFNIFGETTFTCPSYWLAEAFSGSGRPTWKYQYSVTPAYHGADVTAYFSANATSPTKGFISAFSKMWGNFIVNNTPVISIAAASANATNATVPRGSGGDIAWPVYSTKAPIQMNLNTTGGTLSTVVATPNLSYFLRFDPGVTNNFRLVNADTWEGGRGARCRFWRDVAPRVPE